MRALSNLIAVRDACPDALDALERRLRGAAARVWRPAPTWVIAETPLPGAEHDDRGLRAAGFAFAEGREGLVPAGTGEDPPVSAVSPDAIEPLSALPGDFGFIRVMPDASAIAVRSCGGLVPLYVAVSQTRCVIATRLIDAARHSGRPIALDAMAAATWVNGFALFPDGRTPIAGIGIVDRGCAVVVRSAQVRTHRYWDPRPTHIDTPTRARTREHAERVREAVLSSLHADLDAEGANLLTLSGGADSSTLAYLAGTHLGVSLSAVTFLSPDDRVASVQRARIDDLAHDVPFGRRWSFGLSIQERLALLADAPASGLPILHPALGAIAQIMRERPVRVLFGGEFADEVCGGDLTFPDWVRETSLVRALSRPRHLPGGLRAIARWGRQRLRTRLGRADLPYPQDLPALFDADVRAEYREWFDRTRRRAMADPRPHAFLEQRFAFDTAVAMNWEAVSPLGVRRSFPFFTRSTIEVAYACHPGELIGPDTKRLLKASFGDVVPSRHLQRAKEPAILPADLADLPLPSLPPTLAGLFDHTGLRDSSPASAGSYKVEVARRWAEQAFGADR